jgi:hypothetical protein
MSGLDRVRNVSSEPAIAPILQSEDLYAQTVTAKDLVVEETATFPDNYINDLIDSHIPHAFLLMGA